MLQEGQEILEGRFKIIKKLGSGAFGEIFKGKSPLAQIDFLPEHISSGVPGLGVLGLLFQISCELTHGFDVKWKRRRLENSTRPRL